MDLKIKKRVGALVLGVLIVLGAVIVPFVASEMDLWYYCTYVRACSPAETFGIQITLGASSIMAVFAPFPMALGLTIGIVSAGFL